MEKYEINFEEITGNIICSLTPYDPKKPSYYRLSYIKNPSTEGHFKHVEFNEEEECTKYENMTKHEFYDIFIKNLQEKTSNEKLISELKEMYEKEKNFDTINSDMSDKLNENFESNSRENQYNTEIQDQENPFNNLPIGGTYKTRNDGVNVTMQFSAGKFGGYPAEIRTYKVDGKDERLVQINYNGTAGMDEKFNYNGIAPSIIYLMVSENGEYEVILKENLKSEIEKRLGISYEELTSNIIEDLKYDYINLGEEEKEYKLGSYSYMYGDEDELPYGSILPDEISDAILESVAILEKENSTKYSSKENNMIERIKDKLRKVFIKKSKEI